MTQKFTVDRYKGLRGEITLSPDDSQLLVVAGANGSGKSSFLDPIKELLKYKGIKLTPKPIHEGETEARAEFIDTDLDVRLERVWKISKDGTTKSTFTAYALDGAKYPSAVDLVAELTGGDIIDPVEFVLLDEKKQREVLLSKVSLPFDLDALAREKAGAEQRRLLAGQEVKRLTGALASLPAPLRDAPAEQESASALSAELRAAEQSNRQVFELRARKAQQQDQIEELEVKLEAARQALAQTATALESAPTVVDTTAIQSRLDLIDATNRDIQNSNVWHATKAQLDAAEATHAAEQAELDRITKVKAEGLATAKFPAPGLSVTDDGVTVDGVPFIQINTAQQTLVAFDIATSGNPKLKLIFIKSGDYLDDETLELVANRSLERGWTLVMERGRDNSKAIGFEINEGQLA